MDDKTALKMAEEATGIKIEWTVLDSSSAADKLPALLSSEDQPDLYLNVLDQATISKNQDMFYDMSKDGVLEKYAPNVVALYEPYDYFENVTWPDGAIYSLVTTEMFSPIEAWSFSNTIIRQDWLDQLGLPVPTTADELYQTLVAFRDNDMNGNGDATDEIPLSFASNYWQGELWLFAGAFGLHGATWQNFMHYKMLSEDGKVIPSCKTDNFREYIEFFHKLYDEGLMDAEGFSQTGEQYEAKIANNQVGVYPHYVWDPSYETSFTFEGFDGVQVKRDGFVDRAPSDTYKFGFVPTADANIEALLTWWNYLSQKDVALIAEGGNPENSFWEWTEDGNAQKKAVETEVDGETTVTPMAPEDWMVADIVNGYPAMPVCQNRIECKQSTEARLRLHFRTNLRCGEAWHYSDTPSAVAASGEVSTSESKLHRPAVPCICSLFIDKRCEMFFFFPLYSSSMASAYPIEPGQRSFDIRTSCLIESAPTLSLNTSSFNWSPNV